jgi:hypothetical protein
MANSNGGTALRLGSSKALAVDLAPYFIGGSNSHLSASHIKLRDWVWLLLDVPEKLPAAVRCPLPP